ncbi:MAG: type IX secretion system PorP/SprF family membrane protein [Crocinitomicaceae bacterium]|jgi:type IX secretion system PorP/SprF family membrane protein
MIHKIITALTFSLLVSGANAQQNAQFTQYLDNMLYYNPGYAGSRGQMNITGTFRQQWVGFKGAPSTQSLSLHTPLKYESTSVGLTVLNDLVGPINQTWINGSAAYAFRFKRNEAKLSFGVNGGINLINGDLTQLNVVDQDDPLAENYVNEIKPNIGAGIYFHSKKWFAGVSSPQLIENTSSLTNLGLNTQRHYYLSFGGYFQVNRMLKIRPSTLVKVTDNAPLAADMSLAFMFYDQLWVGANYRLTESAGVFVQVQVNNQFKLGYAFDLSTSELIRQNFGTHELLLSYDFKFKKKSISSPRYF